MKLRLRYLWYLITWKIDHFGKCFKGCYPACFDEWLENELLEVEKG